MASETNSKIIPPVEREPAIFIDASTCLIDHLKLSGIPRTERNIVSNLIEMDKRVRIVCWDNDLQEYLILDQDILSGNHTIADRQKFECGTLSELISEEDTLVLPGGSWFMWGGISGWLEQIRHYRNPKVICIIYDLIALRLLALIPPHYTFKYGAGLISLSQLTDAFLGISNYTVADLASYLEEHNVPRPNMAPWRLGDDTLFAWEKYSYKKSPVQDFIANRPFILYVSGVNPRKNHRLLFDIWKRMLEDKGIEHAPVLINLGMASADSNSLVALLRADKELGSHIGIFHGVDDSTLDWLYRNCLFTVFPSLYEGWGLPVAESLKYGKVCIASNATSIPEIAPEQTDLIDPYDFVSWYGRIKEYITDRRALERREAEIKKYQPFSWKESAKSLLSYADGFPKLEHRPVTAPAAYSWNAADPILQPVFLGKGWSYAEQGGRWNEGERAVIIGRFDEPGLYKITLTAKSLPLKGEKTRQITVQCNGMAQEFLDIPDKEQRYTLFGEAIANPAGFYEIRLELLINNPVSPFELNPAINDKRKLGIWLSALSFEKVDARAYQYELNLMRTSALLEDKAGELRKFLQTRGDLREAMKAYGEYGFIFLLLWLWKQQEGQPDLRAKVAAVLRKLHQTPLPGLENYFTSLIALVHKVRPDLHMYDPSSPEGRNRILEWFYRYGVHEYDLFEIISSPL